MLGPRQSRASRTRLLAVTSRADGRESRCRRSRLLGAQVRPRSSRTPRLACLLLRSADGQGQRHGLLADAFIISLAPTNPKLCGSAVSTVTTAAGIKPEDHACDQLPLGCTERTRPTQDNPALTTNRIDSIVFDLKLAPHPKVARQKWRDHLPKPPSCKSKRIA